MLCFVQEREFGELCGELCGYPAWPGNHVEVIGVFLFPNKVRVIDHPPG